MSPTKGVTTNVTTTTKSPVSTDEQRDEPLETPRGDAGNARYFIVTCYSQINLASQHSVSDVSSIKSDEDDTNSLSSPRSNSGDSKITSNVTTN